MGLRIKRVNKNEWIELTIAELQTSKIDRINKLITIKGVKYDLRTAEETEAKGGISQANAMYTYKVDFIFKTLQEAQAANVSVGQKIFAVKEKMFYIKDNTGFILSGRDNSKISEIVNAHFISETQSAKMYLIDPKSPQDLQRVLTVVEFDNQNETVTNVLPNESLLVFRQGVLAPVKTEDGEEPYEGDVVTIKNGRICWAAPSNGSNTNEQAQS